MRDRVERMSRQARRSRPGADAHCSARIASNTPRQSVGTDDQPATGTGVHWRRRRLVELRIGASGSSCWAKARRRDRQRHQGDRRNASQILLHQQQQIPPCQRLVLRAMSSWRGWKVAMVRTPSTLCTWPRACGQRLAEQRRAGPSPNRIRRLRLGQADVAAGDFGAQSRSRSALICLPGAWKQESEARIGLVRREADRGQHPRRKLPRPRRRSAGRRRPRRAGRFAQAA